MSWTPLLPTETDSPEATEALGRALAETLGPGDVLALYGELGAGKTRLARGLVAGLGGNPDDVTSPTFTLVQTYPARVPVHHLDVYRIEHEAALDALGVDELMDDAEAVVLVEWPERLEARLPAHARRIRLEHCGGDRRRIAAPGS